MMAATYNLMLAETKACGPDSLAAVAAGFLFGQPVVSGGAAGPGRFFHQGEPRDLYNMFPPLCRRRLHGLPELPYEVEGAAGGIAGNSEWRSKTSTMRSLWGRESAGASRFVLGTPCGKVAVPAPSHATSRSHMEAESLLVPPARTIRGSGVHRSDVGIIRHVCGLVNTKTHTPASTLASCPVSPSRALASAQPEALKPRRDFPRSRLGTLPIPTAGGPGSFSWTHTASAPETWHPLFSVFLSTLCSVHHALANSGAILSITASLICQEEIYAN